MSKTNQNALLPCPFCGARGLLDEMLNHGVVWFRVSCEGCDTAKTTWCSFKPDAVRIWNKRVSNKDAEKNCSLISALACWGQVGSKNS